MFMPNVYSQMYICFEFRIDSASHHQFGWTDGRMPGQPKRKREKSNLLFSSISTCRDSLFFDILAAIRDRIDIIFVCVTTQL